MGYWWRYGVKVASAAAKGGSRHCLFVAQPEPHWCLLEALAEGQVVAFLGLIAAMNCSVYRVDMCRICRYRWLVVVVLQESGRA